MAVVSQDSLQENLNDHYPLLTEHTHRNANNEYVIHIERRNDAFFSDLSNNDDRPRSSIEEHGTWSSSRSLENSRNPSFATRNEEFGHPRQSLLNIRFWTSFDFLFTVSQIIASAVVISLSIHENSRAPLLAWVVVYTAGCVASLPIMYWDYLQSNQGSEQRRSQQNEETPRGDSLSDQSSYIDISSIQSPEQEDHVNATGSVYGGQTIRVASLRFSSLVDLLMMALACFFSVWFLVGSIWVFPGLSSISEASIFYRLCVAYVTLSCGGYAMPFALCAIMCCCLPLISMLGVREDLNPTQAANEELIDSLPTHKFKSKKNTIGTDEFSVSGEDSVCCICLSSYVDDDELRELPCSHFFHSKCVDRWLRINATCPLCKCEIGEENEELASLSNSSQ